MRGRALSPLHEKGLSRPGPFIIVLEGGEAGARLTLRVELAAEAGGMRADDREALGRRIAGRLRDEILVTPRVELADPGSLPRAEGKAQRVQDPR